jgi:hypothetical protein
MEWGVCHASLPHKRVQGFFELRIAQHVLQGEVAERGLRQALLP